MEFSAFEKGARRNFEDMGSVLQHQRPHQALGWQRAPSRPQPRI